MTGGSRGLGFAAAQALTGEGARVLLSAPHEATATAAVARLAEAGAAAGDIGWVVADNADPATPDRLIAAARDRFGGLDGALISVGGSPAGTVASTWPKPRGPLLGDPRLGMAGIFLQLSRVLPDRYPLRGTARSYLGRELGSGRPWITE